MNRIPVLRFLKEPAGTIDDLNIKYPQGLEYGAFALVSSDSANSFFAEWKSDTQTWEPIVGDVDAILENAYPILDTTFFNQNIALSSMTNGRAIRVGNMWTNIISALTGENINFQVITKWFDGTDMDDTKLDGVIYRKRGDEYLKMAYTQPINIRWFGAKGDGVSDDWQPIQSAINYLFNTGGGELFIPKGTYYLSQRLQTKNIAQVVGNTAIGIKITGEGRESILTRNDVDVADYTSGTTLCNNSVLAIHGPNNAIDNICIKNARVGIYFGQDTRDEVIRSASNYNNIKNIYIESVGTGILFKPGYGCYYNTFSDIHIGRCNIGIHLGTSYFSGLVTSVPNRNVFRKVVVHWATIGLLIHNGDTNSWIDCSYENIADSDTSAITPNSPFLNGESRTGIYIDSSLTTYGIGKNSFINNILENCTQHLHYDGDANNFINSFIDIRKCVNPNPSARLGTFIGTYDTAWAKLNFEYLSQKTSSVDPFFTNPNDPIGLNVKFGYIRDDGMYRKEHLLLNNSTQISGTNNLSKSIYWSLGGVREWFVKATIKINTTSTTDALKINTPTPVDNLFKQTTSNIPSYRFPVIIYRAGYTYETVNAYFDGDAIVIPAPSYGWSIGTTDNSIFFSLRYFQST